MKYLLTFFFLIHLSFNAQAQEALSNIVLHISPPMGVSLIQIGDSVYNKSVIQLPPGKHQMTIWAPKYAPFDTTITVNTELSAHSVVKILQRDPLFLEHKKAISKYHWSTTIPLSASIIGTTLLTIKTRKVRKSALAKWDGLLLAQQEYSTLSPGFVANKRKDFETAKENYNLDKEKYYRLGTATLITAGVATFFIVRTIIKKKPKFTPSAPPFELSYSTDRLPHSLSTTDALVFTYRLNF